MPTVLVADIQGHVRQYLNGDLRLDDFTDRFMPMLWAAAESGDPVAEDLAATVDLLLIEEAQGDRSEEEIRRLLGSVAMSEQQVISSVIQ